MKKLTKNLLIGAASIIVLGGATFGVIQALKPQDGSSDGVENYLSAPENVELSLNAIFSMKTFSTETEQLLSWSPVENAEKFCITIGENDYYTANETQLTYDITDKVKVGQTYDIKIKAIGDNVTYGDSEYTVLTETVKQAPKSLVFTELEDGTYSVKQDEAGTPITGELVIPDTYKGKQVTEIESMGFKETYASTNPFNSKKGIRSIVFPKYLRKIGASAFNNCVKLDTVVVPKDLEVYEHGIFSSCISLSGIVFPDNMLVIPESICYGCTNLKSVTLPNCTIEIGENAFAYSGLTSIDLPQSVTKIGKYAFGTTAITSIRLPSGLKELSGFSETALTEVTIPASVESMAYAFPYCENLTKVEFEEGSRLTEIGTNNFSCTALTQITLPDSVRTIGERAFYSTLFTEFEVPASVQKIAAGAFSNTPLESVNFSTGVTEIGEEAFTQTLLTSVEIPSNVQTIGVSAFRDLALTELILHEGVQSIGNFAFANTPLTSVEIPASVTSIGCGVFSAIPSSSSIEVIGGKLEEITIASGSTSYKVVDGILYSMDGKELIYYHPTKTETEFVSPDGLEKIYSYAFFEAKNLEKIILRESVVTVGSYAFKNCTALTSLILPDNEILLDSYFINGCTSLTLVKIPPNATVRIKTTPATYIEFLDGRTVIGNASIENNNRKPTIIVPTSVTKITGVSASQFFGMGMHLPVTIYYKGTADEWTNVELVKMGTDDITVYYYSETEPPLNSDGTAYDGNYWYYGADGLPVIWEYNA